MWIPGLKKKVQNLVFFFYKMYIIANKIKINTCLSVYIYKKSDKYA